MLINQRTKRKGIKIKHQFYQWRHKPIITVSRSLLVMPFVHYTFVIIKIWFHIATATDTIIFVLENDSDSNYWEEEDASLSEALREHIYMEIKHHPWHSWKETFTLLLCTVQPITLNCDQQWVATLSQSGSTCNLMAILRVCLHKMKEYASRDFKDIRISICF